MPLPLTLKSVLGLTSASVLLLLLTPALVLVLPLASAGPPPSVIVETPDGDCVLYCKGADRAPALPKVGVRFSEELGELCSVVVFVSRDENVS